jgi:uncharacterized protein
MTSSWPYLLSIVLAICLVRIARADEEPALHKAAKEGRLDAVKELLKDRAAIRQADARGCTPLHVAAEHGKLTVVEFLLAEGAEINARSNPLFFTGLPPAGHTPLHLAVAANHADVAGVLIDRGAEIDDKAFPFDRMLGQALREDRLAMVDLLVAKRGKERWPALLETAVKNKSGPVLEALLKVDVDVAKSLPTPPIHWAIAHGQPRLALMFIDRGADVSVVHDFGTPLGRAAERGFDGVVLRLLEKKADVNFGSTVKTTPLQFAVAYGRMKCARILLEHGADAARIDAEARAAIERSEDQDAKAVAELLRRQKSQPKEPR